MKLEIVYRVDKEEYFTVDTLIKEYENWGEVIKDIEFIERNNTILSINNILERFEIEISE